MNEQMSKSNKHKNNNGKKKRRERPENSTFPNSSHINSCIGFYGDTNVGLVRTNNEDSFVCQTIWDEQTVLAIAIDGLGGYEGGEEAARIAKEVVVSYLEASSNGDRLELLKQAVASANNTIYETSKKDVRYHLMGCVLTAIIVDIKGKIVYMAHVGDSRLYSYRHDILTKLSHDHSYVGYCEEMGDLTEEQAMHHPNRNVVDRVLGHEPHLALDKSFIESEVFPLDPYTVYLLCSDGLTDMITTAAIAAILAQKSSIKEKVDALIKAALDAGGKDNVTVVLVEYLEDKQEEKKKEHIDEIQHVADDDETKRITSAKHPINWIVAIMCLVLGFCVGLFVGSKRPCQSCGKKEAVLLEVDENQMDSSESASPFDTTKHLTVIDSSGND